MVQFHAQSSKKGFTANPNKSQKIVFDWRIRRKSQKSKQKVANPN
jgi:hypothetical protein